MRMHAHPKSYVYKSVCLTPQVFLKRQSDATDALWGVENPILMSKHVHSVMLAEAETLHYVRAVNAAWACEYTFSQHGRESLAQAAACERGVNFDGAEAHRVHCSVRTKDAGAHRPREQRR